MEFIASDGTDLSEVSTVRIIPAGINDPPVIDLDASGPNNFIFLTFQERGDPINLHNGLMIYDLDDVNLCSAVVVITNPQDPEDRLVDNGIGDDFINIDISPTRIEFTAITPRPIAIFENIIKMVSISVSF